MYTNRGKGLVFKAGSTIHRLAELFEENPYRTSEELNDLLGWQFSQAVFFLRRKQGWTINTEKIGKHRFAYRAVQFPSGGINVA